jgi:hypothetical protein
MNTSMFSPYPTSSMPDYVTCNICHIVVSNIQSATHYMSHSKSSNDKQLKLDLHIKDCQKEKCSCGNR